MVPRQRVRSAAVDGLDYQVECLSAFFAIFRRMESRIRPLLRKEVCPTARCRRNSRFDREGRRRAADVLARLHWLHLCAGARQLGDGAAGHRRAPLKWSESRSFSIRSGAAIAIRPDAMPAVSSLEALNMMNNAFVMNRIHNANNGSTVQQLLRQTTDPLAIIEGLYLATLNRFPTLDEITIATSVMRRLGNQRGAESLQWALMNKLEFLFSY